MRICAVGRVWAALFVSVAIVDGATAGSMREHDPPAENRYSPYWGYVPSCDDPGVLSDIRFYFQRREAEFWNSDLQIAAFEAPAETGYRANGHTFIPRRYCRADAWFSDGKRRRVVYNVGEGLGFIGFAPGVTWCVEGLDPSHAFSPNCRAAGP